MTLTTAEQVRLRIQDQPTIFDVTRTGDGALTQFDLGTRVITSATAFVLLTGAWTAAACTVASGWAAFSGAISAGSAVRVRGVQSVFSEDEIGQFTADGGSVLGAALEACTVLMFDGLKRAKWAAPDGTSYDDTAAMQQLNALYDRLRQELAEAATSEGGWAEWALE